MASYREISNDCIAVAFYGVTANSELLAQFYEDLIDWFNLVECTPDKIAVHGRGFGGKPVGFARTHLRLCTQGLSDVKSIDIFAMLPNGNLPTVHWWATAYLDLAYKPCFVLEARSSVATLGDDRLAQLIKSCISSLKPVYGIGYHRDHDKGPGFYAIGLNYGNAATSGQAYEQALTISRWGDLAMVKEVYKQGTLRDVFPHNYLSEPQLTRRVGQQTLQDWISSDSLRGTLITLDDRIKLWKVATAQIKSIRDVLWSAGLIFDWKRYLNE